jgi:ankyrin repeat protein
MRALAFAALAMLAATTPAAAGKPEQEALCTAAKSGTPADVEAALKSGGKVNGECTGTGSGTPLGSAMIMAKVDNMEVLLKAGAKINNKSDMRLGYARNAASAELLLKYGAKVGAVDDAGTPPLMHITSTYASNYDGIYKMTEQDAIDIAKLLIAHGAKVDQKNKYGSTALIEAAFACLPNLTALLIEKGADVNATSFGQTALHRVGNIKDMNPGPCGETEQVLLAHGATK